MNNVLITKKNIVIFILINALSLACKEQAHYKYASNLSAYLANEFNIETSALENRFFLIIPINSCSPCVQKSVQILVNNKENNQLTGLILADREKDILKYKQLKEAKLKNLYYDLNSGYTEYELGIFSPVLVHILNGGIISVEKLDVVTINQVILKHNLIPVNY